MLNRNDAIEMYVKNMYDEELMSLVNALNSWDGPFENCQWYDMDELDDLLSGSTPTEILSMADGLSLKEGSTLIGIISSLTPTAILSPDMMSM